MVGRFKIGHLLLKGAIQVLASMFAVFIAFTVTNENFYNKHGVIVGYPSMNLKDYTYFQCFLAEFISSALFLFAYSSTLVDKRGPASVFGFAIGSVVLLSTLVFGNISGSAVFFSKVVGAQLLFGRFENAWIYFFAIVFGSFFAGGYYNSFLLNPSDVEDIIGDDFFMEKNMKTIENINQANSLKY